MRSFHRMLALATIAATMFSAIPVQAGPLGRAIFGPRVEFKQTTVIRGTMAPACAMKATASCNTATYYQTGTVATPQAPGKVLPVPQAPAKTIPAPQATTTTYPAPLPPQVMQNDSAAFLAAVNLWRAQNGRRPLAWDNNLAAFAARNVGIHSLMPAGCSQCWSGTHNLMSSLSMWKVSGAHRAILLNATTTIGASSCPSGATANVR